MKQKILLMQLTILIMLAGFSLHAVSQETTPKLMDPGWFMENNASDIKIFWVKADSLYWAGKYEETIVSCLEVLRLDGKHQNAAITIASCYGLLGKDTLSALFLTRAWDLGYNTVSLIENDHDFDNVRQKPIFKNTFDSLVHETARLDSLMGERVYIQAPAISYYRVKLPKGYDREKRYPLLVTLHGYSGNLDRHFAGVIGKMREPDFIFVSIQAPYPLPNARESYRWNIAEYGPEQKRKSIEMSQEYIADFIRKLKAEYHPTKTFLMGHSQGGNMTYLAGLRYPRLFDGLISFSGALDTANISAAQIRSAKNLKVLIVHGRKDKAVEFSYAEKARDHLKAGGVDVTFFAFDGGHEMPEAGVKKAYEWIERK
jgi:phospholipase/carboxylesterase